MKKVKKKKRENVRVDTNKLFPSNAERIRHLDWCTKGVQRRWNKTKD